MRILYFHQHFSTPDGGTGTRSFEMASALSRAGHDVHLVCGSSVRGSTGVEGPYRHGRRVGIVNGFRVTELQVSYSNRQGFARRIVAFVDYAARAMVVAVREDCDLVFATSTPLTAALPGMAARLLRGRPFVFEIRDLWPDVPRDMGIIRSRVILSAVSAFERAAYRTASGCIGLSPGMVDAIRERGPARLPVALVPNGCDLELFDPRSARQGRRAGPDPRLERARAQAGLREGDVVAMFTGAHGHANGLEGVLDAAAELLRRGREDVRVVFIGDGARKAALVERCREEGLRNCTFVDPLPKRLLSGFMARADVCLMILANVPAFYYGTSPNKFFDYIAIGKPVVVNHPGWLADMVSSESIGEAVAPDDPLALADALERLADSPERRRRASVAARALAEREFDRRELAAKFVAFLELVERQRRDGRGSGATVGGKDSLR